MILASNGPHKHDPCRAQRQIRPHETTKIASSANSICGQSLPSLRRETARTRSKPKHYLPPSANSKRPDRFSSGCCGVDREYWCQKKQSPFVGLVPIEFVIGRQRPIYARPSVQARPCADFPSFRLLWCRSWWRSRPVHRLPSVPTHRPVALGNRTARLLPHLETCIAASIISN